LNNLVDFVSLCTTHPEAAKPGFFLLLADGEDSFFSSMLLRKLAFAYRKPCRLLSCPNFLDAVCGKTVGAEQPPLIVYLEIFLQIDSSKARTLLWLENP